MRKITPLILVLPVLLAGCWQSAGSLVGNVRPVQPFAEGRVLSFNPAKPGDVSHARLTKEKDGVYRLTVTDGNDQGDAVLLRFIALPDLPQNMFVFEAVSDDKCQPGQTCHAVTAKSERDYGLVRQTKAGAEVVSPDCDKSSPAAKLPGVKAGDYSICSFTSRASLETALLDLAKRSWKANLVYKYE